MSERTRHVRLGLFVVAGLVLAAAGALVLGGRPILGDGLRFATFIPESVQGLNVGTPVKLLGVTVGRVAAIGFAPGGGVQRVRVVGELEVGALPAAWRARPAESLRREVQEGLRARLTSVGLSGQLYLELDDVPGAPPPPEAGERLPLLIPSVPSVQQRLVGSAQEVADKLAELDLARLADRLEALLRSTDRVLAEEVAPAFRELRTSLAALPPVLAQTEALLGELTRLAAGQGADLRRMVENLRALTEDLRRIAARAERDPGGVLFGSPPAPVEPGRSR
jgi:paraquat-inducible protein B